MKDEVKLHIYKPDLSTELELPYADGGIKAGFPSPAQDYLTESIDLNKILIRHPETTFYAKVAGDSLTDAGICDMDIAIIDKSLECQNGDYVAAQCSRKLREQHTVCSSITIFAHTSRFREDLPQSYIYRTVQLQVPTNDHQELVSLAVKMLRSDWKEGDGYFYKKAGVIVWGISRDNAIQTSLFDTVDREKQAALAKTIDEINRKNGHNKIRVAVQGNEKGWQLKREYISKQYTTNLDDVIVLKVKYTHT